MIDNSSLSGQVCSVISIHSLLTYMEISKNHKNEDNLFYNAEDVTNILDNA